MSQTYVHSDSGQSTAQSGEHFRLAIERRQGSARRERPLVFAVEAVSLSGAPGVIVRGEVDIGTASQLSEALDAAIRASTGAFVIDLCDVEFIDSSGINALIRARALLGREERALAVICPPGPARRIFEIAGITDLFTLFASRQDAAASLQPAQHHRCRKGEGKARGPR